MRNILWFKDITLDDVVLVGGKNASLGEMIRELRQEGIIVPNGFATTAKAYFNFLEEGRIKEKIKKILSTLNVRNIRNLHKKSKEIRKIILKTPFPKDLREKILSSYQTLSAECKGKEIDVAVRSSATLEDMPTASFAGMQETYLNVKGKEKLLLAIKKCFASLFTPRSISYREEKGFSHDKVALSCGVQKMIRSDTGASGVIFTLDTESGFPDVVLINATYGLGETIVQGRISPDEYIVFKRKFIEGYPSIIKKKLGSKKLKMISVKDDKRTKVIRTPKKEQESFVLSEKEVLKLASWAITLERHYSKKAGRWQPMDIEWAKDGPSGRLFFVQARPETVHRGEEKKSYVEYKLENGGKVITSGVSVGEKIGQGRANIIKDIKEIGKFKKGEILVTKMTDPDWEPIMKIASGIVTNEGGRTCHSAIVSRELGIPCVVGTKNGTEVIPQGKDITIDCSRGTEGYVLEGKILFSTKKYKFNNLPRTETKICLNIGSPDIAFKSSFLPVDGVGLARTEFIFASSVKVHPLALLNFDKLKDKKIKQEIAAITIGYGDKKEFFIEKMAQGVSQIAAAFYPKEIIVRFSDFKTNEYAELVGGQFFEPKESNPMIGWRGASRYYSKDFKEAFLLECKAIKRAREKYGLKNISVMVPFCRTLEEGKKVIEIIKKAGLINKSSPELRDLSVYVMCEIPSNVILAKEFLEIFDGMSIGSNDLTQLTLGIDRDSAILAKVGDERNEAVKKLIREAIRECNVKGKYSGICGDAPSTFRDFAKFLVDCGIKSISINPDVVVKTRLVVAEKEKERRQ